MINTTTVKEIGKAMMIIGGAIFGVGFSATSVCWLIEYKAAKNEHKLDLLTEETKALEKKHCLEAERIIAETKKDDILAEKIAAMDKKEFAKYQAEATAKASEEAIAKANDILAKANNDISAMKLECSEKVSKAVQEANEATTKYNNLLSEYKNRDEVLKAKKEIDNFLKASESQKETLSDLKTKLAILA